MARVRLARGSGKITVNDKPISEYCYTEQLASTALRPLQTVDMASAIDADINVKGGGPVLNISTILIVENYSGKGIWLLISPCPA